MTLLYKLINHLAFDLINNSTVEEIRVKPDVIELIIEISDTPNLREHCPIYCDLFAAVMLRELEDFKTDDQVVTQNTGRREEGPNT